MRQSMKWNATIVVAVMMVAAKVLAQEKLERTSKPEAGRDPRTVRRIVVSLRDRRLALLENDRILKVYEAAIGASRSPSPTGSFNIITRVSNPAYYGRGKVIPPGKNNPVGSRWLGLSLKGFGIHGTNNPRSIGRKASHGCIRLRNRDVEELFELVRMGDLVELHAERTNELAQIFGVSEPAVARPAPQPAPVALSQTAGE